jgi:WD40 repeat protein
MEVVGYSILPTDISDSYCAFNPWNKMLYMPNATGQDHFISAFDVSQYFERLLNRDMWGEPISITRRADENFYFFSKGKIVKVSSVQGLVFSPNGRVYLTWYAHKKGGPWYNRIAVYDSLTGNFIDEKEFDFEGTYDEVEGLSLHPSGTLMVAVCDNDYVEVPCVDEFMVFAYKHKDDQFSV